MPLVLVADGATRAGYSPLRNGVSQLGLGDRAWIETTNFVLGGLLLAAFAAGLRRFLLPGRGCTWVPILMAAAAAGWVVAGKPPQTQRLATRPEFRLP